MPDGDSRTKFIEQRDKPDFTYTIGFLYNHEAAHQVAHSAPIAAALATADADVRIVLLATSNDLLAHARSHIPASLQHSIRFELLQAPGWQHAFGRMLDPVAPFSRIANLMRHSARLGSFDILVVPERTSLFLQTLQGPRAPLLIYTKHGSGDRAQGYSSAVGRFDLVLLSGRKLQHRLVCAGRLAADRAAIVGYPKFDTINRQKGPRLFPNERPTVIYNPHPAPELSSWYDLGVSVLDYFAAQERFNLIFAPHVMLFRRRLHITPNRWAARWRADLPSRYARCPHLLIDTGSPRLLDMTYTQAADIYLGDVSSQVYEFLLNPRPVIFLDPRRRDWRNDANFAHWNFGPVVSDSSQLSDALSEALAQPDLYRAEQEHGFRYTFDLDDRPSAVRAAQAIAAFARKRLLSRQRHAVDAHRRRVDAE